MAEQKGEPMDLIDRQSMIDKFEPWLKVKGYSEGELNVLKAVLYELRVMPPVQPEQKWIPCSERLPKPGYCITSNEYNGVSEDFYYDDHFWNADKNAYEVIAWMPLPEPAKLEND